MDELDVPDTETPDDEPVPGQSTLFGGDEDFHKHWQEWTGMPEFVAEQVSPHSSLLVHFMTKEDRDRFAVLVDQPISPITRSLYYPRLDWDKVADLRWRSTEPADKERRRMGNQGSLYGKGGKA